ncbi:MAG: hypothetical protein KGJ80_15880 [Chloroflexota bacterium]|nr:hypothetical protein [Chloroflexota bacterium]
MNLTERWRAQAYAHSDFLFVFALFVSFRLMMLMLFSPVNFLTLGYTDFMYYYEMASLSSQGHFPFIDFWFEYPPVFTYLVIGVYQLTRHMDSFDYFARTLSLVMLPFESLVLINLYRIARRLYGGATAVRLAWIYAMLLLPVFFWQYSFDSMVAALVLQSLYWLMTDQRAASGITLALAIATKFSPAFLIGTAWRFAANVREAARYTFIVAAGVALIFLPFVLISPAFTIASFQSLMAVSSWETIWALMDGNKSNGDVGPLPRHFDLTMAGVPTGNPSLLPMWATLIPFALISLFVFTRRVDRNNPRHMLIFTGITLTLFHLWSKGWSPQWVTLVLPFLLLFYPNGRGVLFSLVFSFVTLLDWPLSFVLGVPLIFVVSILIRTALFVLIGIDLYLELVRAPTPRAANL